jgi:Inner membrane protein YqiJ, N-terminal/Inner membrane protein YqiJ, OB-fold
MLSLLTAQQNLPFSVSLAIMLGIALLEGFSTLLGAGLSHLLETLVPHLDLDLDAGHLDSGHSLSRLLGWLRIGQVPALILLVVFLTSFGLIGLAIQTLARHSLGSFLPAGLASLLALVLAIPAVRVLGGALGAILPKDETDAVSEASLVGRIATVTLGVARPGYPAEARTTDTRGTTHYLMVEPDAAGQEFPAGTAVLLVSKQGAVFKAIPNPSPALVDRDV